MGLLLEFHRLGGQRKGEQEIHLLLEAELRVEWLEGLEDIGLQVGVAGICVPACVEEVQKLRKIHFRDVLGEERR